MRSSLPKFDIILAAATASPVATTQVAHALDHTGPARFFTVPVFEFTYSGSPVFVTAPDVLALASSFVLIARFCSWGISKIIATIQDRKARK